MKEWMAKLGRVRQLLDAPTSTGAERQIQITWVSEVIHEMRGAADTAACLRTHVAALLEILDSKHIKFVENSARIHGYELDRPTATAYGNAVAAARRVI